MWSLWQYSGVILWIGNLWHMLPLFYYKFICHLELFPVLLVNQRNRTTMTASFVGKTEPFCGVLRSQSLLWGARARQNRQSNEEGGDVNVAAERSDWSVRMNLSSLHALTEQHLSQRQPESLSQSPHQHTKDFQSQRAAQIQKNDKRERKET